MSDTNDTILDQLKHIHKSPQYFAAILEKAQGATELVGVFDTLELAQVACQEATAEHLTWTMNYEKTYWRAFGGYYRLEGTSFKIYPVVLNVSYKAARDE